LIAYQAPAFFPKPEFPHKFLAAPSTIATNFKPNRLYSLRYREDIGQGKITGDSLELQPIAPSDEMAIRSL
jgi:hypothetical protein